MGISTVILFYRFPLLPASVGVGFGMDDNNGSQLYWTSGLACRKDLTYRGPFSTILILGEDRYASM